MTKKEEKKKNNSPNQTDNVGGRPELYTPEELHNKANQYFKFCESTKINRGINGTIHKPYTMSGINLWLKVSKNYLSEKAKDKKFMGTVGYIRSFIENDVEEKALMGVYSPSASSFNLINNFNRVNRSEVNNMNANINLDTEDSDEFKDILKDNNLI